MTFSLSEDFAPRCIQNTMSLHYTSQFTKDKARVLDKADLSRKGNVDGPIRPLVDYINACDDYYTTSSCSGRAVVFCEGNDQRKKGCHWLLVSHDPITCRDLMEAYMKTAVLKKDSSRVSVHEDVKLQQVVDKDLGYAFFKFEPFVLHMMCRSMDKAQTALQIAVGSGFRNSGISCGKKGKIMLAVRSTHSLEVPLCHDGLLLVSEEYLRHLVELCNKKFTENSLRIQRFYHLLKSSIEDKQAPVEKRRSSCDVQNSTDVTEAQDEAVGYTNDAETSSWSFEYSSEELSLQGTSKVRT